MVRRPLDDDIARLHRFCFAVIKEKVNLAAHKDDDVERIGLVHHGMARNPDARVRSPGGRKAESGHGFLFFGRFRLVLSRHGEPAHFHRAFGGFEANVFIRQPVLAGVERARRQRCRPDFCKAALLHREELCGAAVDCNA